MELLSRRSLDDSLQLAQQSEGVEEVTDVVDLARELRDLRLGFVPGLRAATLARRSFQCQAGEHLTVRLPDPERTPIAPQVESFRVVVGVEEAEVSRLPQLEVGEPRRHERAELSPVDVLEPSTSTGGAFLPATCDR